MNSNKGYTTLGWLVWHIGRRATKRKATRNRSKVIAAGAVAGVAAVGIALAGRRACSGGDE